MISRQAKANYYRYFDIPMRLSSLFYRAFLAPKHGQIKAHLGPGRDKYLSGWINVDANLFTARPDVWSDLRHRLPFRDSTVDVFYSHHVIEHLPDEKLPFHFREMHRCLKPGGVIRIGGPNGDSAMRKAVENDLEWFSDWPDNRRSIGGRFANFILCRGEHLTILTYSYLEELLSDAGFVDIRECRAGAQTHFPELIDASVLDKEDEVTLEFPHTLIVEAARSEEI